jgi:hypothetical protein
MEALTGIVIFVLGQVVVEGLVNGFDASLDGVADDIGHALGSFFDVLKVQWLVVTVE